MTNPITQLTLVRLALGAAIAWVFLCKANAAIAPNDTCTGAIPLTLGTVYSMDTSGATSTGDPLPTCQNVFGKGVWFTFTAPTSVNVTVSTCGSGFDTVLQVFSGTCSGLTPVACDDDNGPACDGLQASLSFNTAGGTTYYILVGGYNSSSGSLEILVAVSNDACAGAIQLSPGIPYHMNTTAATSASDPTPICQAIFGKGVWFTYSAQITGLVGISTCGSGFDTVLEVYTGTCGSLIPVACDDDNGPACAGLQASLVLNATAGTTYYILAGGYNSAGGDLFVTAGLPCVPATARPPQTQTAEAGSTIRLTTVAGGTPPVSYQWFFNGNTALDHETNATLNLANLGILAAGAYSVVVTNSCGGVTSAPAIVNVVSPVARKYVPAINLSGDVGSFLKISYRDDLGLSNSWEDLAAVALNGSPQTYFDLTDPLPDARFYRAGQTNTPNIAPALEMSIAAAITLNGAIGDQLRIDCIDAVGPTNAWVTLATVTLTNPSQLYFDNSTPGQPRRLYRVVPVP